MSIRTRSEARCKASVSARMDIVSRAHRLAETIALANWMRGLKKWRTMFHQKPTQLSNTNKAITRTSRNQPYWRAAETLGMAFLPLDFLLQPMLRPLNHSQRMNPPRRKRKNAEEALAFDASYKPFKRQENNERRNVGSHLWHS